MFQFKNQSSLFEHRRSPKSVSSFPVVTTLLRGTVRQMLFTAHEKLLILGGRGVDVYDPTTLELERRWLDDIFIQSIHLAGDALVVLVVEGSKRLVYRVAFGDEVGKPLFETTKAGSFSISASAQSVAVPTDLGVDVLGFDGTRKSFEIDEASLEGTTVSNAVMNEDGTIVAACSGWRAASAWEVSTGATLIELTSFDAPHSFILSGDSLLVPDNQQFKLHDLRGGETRYLQPAGDGKIVVSAGRMARIDHFGGYTEFFINDQTFGETQPGLEQHYGSMNAEGIGALSENFVATFAGSYGVVTVHLAAGTVAKSQVSKDGFITDIETFSVDRKGDRFAISHKYRDEAILLDRKTQKMRIITGLEGINAPAVSEDGATVIAACGSNLGPREVYTAPFDGSAEPQLSHKVLAWSRRCQTFSKNLYAINTYKLGGGGYLGIYEVGKSRAMMKLKGDAYLFAINSAGTRAAVVWDAGGISLHDLEAKGAVLRSWDERAMAIGIAPAGAIAFICSDGRTAALHIESDKVSSVVPLEFSRSRNTQPLIVFDPTGALVFVGAPSGELQVHSATDGSLIETLPLHAGGFVGLEFAGGSLWSTGEDGFIHAIEVGASAAESEAPSPKIAEGEVEMAPTKAWKPKRPIALIKPENPEGISVEPFVTDWAKTQQKTFVANLKRSGFVLNESSEHADTAMDLYAPNVGIAVVAIDVEHGCSTLSFHEWDGTKTGGGVMRLGDVDENLYSYAFTAVRAAYSDD